ncbi:hypothetical protein CL652_00020 [bacterium]|nr:hypothetical protein [bacterium]|tara:strand:+ start:4926 stop:5750 length:825 start_codon:yes stop_codon:yes gene_type:complete
MRTLGIFTIFITAAPLFAFAAALNAGVVNGVWFSDPNPEAGEEVRIFTAVQNSSGETVSGTVAFLVNGDIVGSVAFTVDNNEVRAVSVPYVFEDGAHEVSAYITSSQEENVVYTIAPDTSVSVAPRTKPSGQDTDLFDPASLERATTSLAVVTKTLAEVSKNVAARVKPVAESVARDIESFRDTILATSTVDTVSTVLPPQEGNKAPPKAKGEAYESFVDSSKAIVKSDGVNFWKKVAGIGLSFLALLIRWWFVLVILAVCIVFWLLVRGRRVF